MSGRLKVDTGRLRGIAAELRVVAGALDGTGAAVAGLSDVLGSRDCVEVLRDFEHDWHLRRGRLCHSLEVVAGMSGQAASTFESADHSLAQCVGKTAQ